MLLCARPCSWQTWSLRLGIYEPGFIQQTLNRWHPSIELEAALVGDKGGSVASLASNSGCRREVTSEAIEDGMGIQEKGFVFVFLAGQRIAL